MNKLFKIVAPVVVLIVSVGVVTALSAAKPAPEKKEDTQRFISLYVDEVKSDVVTLSVQAEGEVRPKTEIDLIPQVSGRIVAISQAFAEGAEFVPGETLIKIDDTNYVIAKTRAEANLAAARVALERELANAKIKKEHCELQWMQWLI